MARYLKLIAPILAVFFLVADSQAQPPSMGGGRSRGEGGMRGGPGGGGGMMGGRGGTMGGPGGGMMGGRGGMMGGPGGGMMGGRGGSGGFSRGGGPGQSAGGDRGGGGRDRSGGGRDRSGGGRDRGFGPPSGEGGPSAEDRFARFEGMLRGFDSNKDGVIDPKEVPEDRRRFLGFIGARMGVDFSKPVAIDKLKKKASQQFGGKSKEPEPLVPGFGVEEEQETVLAFGEREPTATSASSGGSSARGGADGEQDARAQRFAEMMMSRYDRDGNGVLERDKGEWDGIRGDPNEIDRNNDGRIDRDEMIARVSAYMGGRGGNRGGDRGGGGDRGDGDRGSGDEMASNNGRRSYRFLSARERLPEGLPSWFEDRDRDQDGQVTMAEYSSSWTDSKAREFLRYDGNDDGVITPEECLVGMSRPDAGPPPSAGPGPRSEGPGPGPGAPSPGAETKPAEKPASSSGDKPWWMK